MLSIPRWFIGIFGLWLLVTACAPVSPTSPAPSPSTPAVKADAPARGKPEVTNLRVGEIVAFNTTTLFAADKLGYFKEEGLTLERLKLGGGAELLPALQAGQLDISLSNTISAFQGRDAGFDFMIISGQVTVPERPPDQEVILARTDGGVNTLKDLEGKKFGVNNLNSILWLYTVAVMDKQGVDSKKVQFLEVPFPSMSDALLRGQVDAVVNVEPFVTTMLDTGKVKKISDLYSLFTPNFDHSTWIASEKWLRANPNAARGFVRAIWRSIDYLNANDAKAREFAIEYTGLKPELAARIMTVWRHKTVDLPSLQAAADLAHSKGLLKNKLDTQAMVWESARSADWAR